MEPAQFQIPKPIFKLVPGMCSYLISLSDPKMPPLYGEKIMTFKVLSVLMTYIINT